MSNYVLVLDTQKRPLTPKITPIHWKLQHPSRCKSKQPISTAQGLVQGISHKYCKPIQRKDGYNYGF